MCPSPATETFFEEVSPSPHPTPFGASTLACGARSLGASSFLEVWLWPWFTTFIYSLHSSSCILEYTHIYLLTYLLTWCTSLCLTCILFFACNDARCTSRLAVLLQCHVQAEQELGILNTTSYMPNNNSIHSNAGQLRSDCRPVFHKKLQRMGQKHNIITAVCGRNFIKAWNKVWDHL